MLSSWNVLSSGYVLSAGYMLSAGYVLSSKCHFRIDSLVVVQLTTEATLSGTGFEV